MKRIIGMITLSLLVISTTLPVKAAAVTNVAKEVYVTQQLRSADTGKITASDVRLRATAGLSGTIIALLQKGELLEVGDVTVNKDGYTWYAVKVISTGKSGYVASNYVEIIPPE